LDKDTILSVLGRLRGLPKYLSDQPEQVYEDFAFELPVRHKVFPCDIVDLRKVLRDGQIKFSPMIPLFSLKFAEKYLRNYSLFLIVDSSRMGVPLCRCGSLDLLETDKLVLGDNFLRILVNEPAARDSFDVVAQLVKEYGADVECLRTNSVPGLSSPQPKLSSKKKIKQAQLDPSIKIDLTQQERDIFDYIIAVKRHYGLSTRLLVAGGWVRDKLLGKESKDIDIAVSMSGFQLAQAMEEAAKKYSIKDVGTPYDTSMDKDADPNQRDRSSELLVGTVDIFGIEVEFVPMRKEEYDKGEEVSRRPDVEFVADPVVDAKRRDLTINALFYDIEDQQVYDYVGGVRDLGMDQNSIYLRTPLDPLETFKDDPLRVLRVLRFHSKYPGSLIDENILQALNHPEVHEAYEKKVRTERAGPEIMKMLMGENPVGALRLLFESGLYKTVFKINPGEEGVHPDGMMMDQQSPFHIYNLLEHTLEVVSNLNKIMHEKGESPKMRGVMNLAALFHDFGKMTSGKPHPDQEGRMLYSDHEDHSVEMATKIMNSLGLEGDDKEFALQVIKMHMSAISDPDKWSKRRIGRFIRKSIPHGKEEKYKDLWKYILYHAEADSMSSNPENYDPQARQGIMDMFVDFTSSPAGQAMSSILGGHEIMAMFPTMDPKTGFIDAVKEKVQEWQDNGLINIESGPANAVEQAKQLIQQNMADVMTHIQEYIAMRGKDTMACNWFNRIKKAQTIPTGEIAVEDPEITKGPLPATPEWREGQKVRDRRKGVANPQEYGIIDKISGQKMRIIWNPEDRKNKRTDIYDMVEDTEVLSFLIAEV